MTRRRWVLLGLVALIVGVLVIVVRASPRFRGPVALTGEFTLDQRTESVPPGVLESDFRDRLENSGSGPESVTCLSDLGAGVGSAAHCDAQFGRSFKGGTPQAFGTSAGWLADRADYSVTALTDSGVAFAIAPGLSGGMLESALGQDLGTATFLQCPQEGIAGVAGTTVSCQANYGYPDGPCADPFIDEQGRTSKVLRRCTLLVGVRKVSGLFLDLEIVRGTPPD